MKSYLNVQLGGPGEDLFSWLHELGFNGIRHGTRMSHDWGYTRMVFESFRAVQGLAPLFLLPFEEDEIDTNDVLDFTEMFASQISEWGFDVGNVAIEFVNEPNLFSDFWKKNPEELGETFVKAIQRIRKYAKNVTILTPSISNLGIREIEYAKRLFTPIRAKASDYAIAFHRYPSKWHRAHNGLASRDEELGRFIEAATDSNEFPELWLTETGRRQAQRRPKKFPLCWLNDRYRISEEEQADFAQWEYGYWKTRVNALVWYQLNDGPDEYGHETYGIRRHDLAPKAIVRRFPIIHKLTTT